MAEPGPFEVDVDGDVEMRTRDGVRPLYVSPGHKVSLERAVRVVLECGRGYRLPEPTRLAHIESNRERSFGP